MKSMDVLHALKKALKEIEHSANVMFIKNAVAGQGGDAPAESQGVAGRGGNVILRSPCIIVLEVHAPVVTLEPLEEPEADEDQEDPGSSKITP